MQLTQLSKPYTVEVSTESCDPDAEEKFTTGDTTGGRVFCPVGSIIDPMESPLIYVIVNLIS